MLSIKQLVLLFLFSLNFFQNGYGFLQEKEYDRRIQAHLTINDLALAYKESQEALTFYPQSACLYEAYLYVLARQGNEKLLLQTWDAYHELFPENAMKQELIEEMAWGVLNKASNSSSLIMRQLALIAAHYSQDRRGIDILYRGLKDSNHAVRAAAVSLCFQFRDRKLTEKIKHLFQDEKVWAVRQGVIRAIGEMKICSLKPKLESLIMSEQTIDTEKKLAIASLIQLLDTLNRSESERLCLSSHAGLRQLGCQAITFFQTSRDLDLIFKLLGDPCANVRRDAYQTLGLLRPLNHKDKIISAAQIGLQDLNPLVKISAAWLLTLYDPAQGMDAFKPLLQDEDQDRRLYAASALNSTGQYGLPLTKEQFYSHPDLYVRLNLVWGLIHHPTCAQDVSSFLRFILSHEKVKWTKREEGLFHVISKRQANHSVNPMITIEVENHLIRLEILNTLAMMKDPFAQQAIRDYLSERSWGITAAASALLLTAGDENAIELVKQLLDDPQPHIRLQAALILSMWSREEQTIQLLKNAYLTSQIDTKSKILESLGRIGSIESVPFLIQKLKESSQTLRIIAALALIQCLNH